MFKIVRNEMPLKRVKGFYIFTVGAVRLAVIASILTIMFSLPCFTEEKPPEAIKVQPPVLKKAVLCEKITKNKPVYEGVVFSASKERLFCFTNFEPVYGESYIFHKYYFKDKFSSKTKLSIKKQPGGFATYSMIQLRESDIGPWLVEITDAEDNVLHTIRFSITD